MSKAKTTKPHPDMAKGKDGKYHIPTVRAHLNHLLDQAEAGHYTVDNITVAPGADGKATTTFETSEVNPADQGVDTTHAQAPA
jgi:hypothetical protein